MSRISKISVSFATGLIMLAMGVVYAQEPSLDPAGTWRVEGSNPDGGVYQGVATVVRKGDGYVVQWRIGEQTFNGWGVHSRDSFAVAYTNGVALYVIDEAPQSPDGEGADRLYGTWSYLQNGRLGLEIWTRRDKPDGAPSDDDVRKG